MDAGPYTFIAADALVFKARQGGRVVNVHARLATGVNADGHREILGLDVTFGHVVLAVKRRVRMPQYQQRPITELAGRRAGRVPRNVTGP